MLVGAKSNAGSIFGNSDLIHILSTFGKYSLSGTWYGYIVGRPVNGLKTIGLQKDSESKFYVWLHDNMYLRISWSTTFNNGDNYLNFVNLGKCRKSVVFSTAFQKVVRWQSYSTKALKLFAKNIETKMWSGRRRSWKVDCKREWMQCLQMIICKTIGVNVDKIYPLVNKELQTLSFEILGIGFYAFISAMVKLRLEIGKNSFLFIVKNYQ